MEIEDLKSRGDLLYGYILGLLQTIAHIRFLFVSYKSLEKEVMQFQE